MTILETTRQTKRHKTAAIREAVIRATSSLAHFSLPPFDTYQFTHQFSEKQINKF